MADAYSKVVELLDNSQYLAALKKAEEEEKTLTALRTAGGQAAVKAYRDVERAQKQAANTQSTFVTSTQENTAAIKNLSFQLNDVVTGLVSGQKPMQVLTQQGGQIFQAFQTAQGGATALAAELGSLALAYAPLLAIAAPLAAGIYLDVEAERKAAEQAKKRADAVKELTDALKAEESQQTTVVQLTEEYNTRYAVATGTTDGFVEAQKNEYNALVSKTHALQGAANAALDVAEKEAKRVAGLKDATDQERAAARADLQTAQEERAASIKDSETALATLQLTQKAELAKHKEEESRKRNAKAIKAETAEMREQEAWVKHVNDEEDKRRAALEKSIQALEDLKTANEKATGSEEDRIEKAAQASRDKAIAIAQEARTVADGADEQKRINDDLRDALKAINEREVDDLKKAEEEKTKAAKKAADDRKKLMEDEYSNYADLAGSVSDLFSAMADSNVDAAKKGDKAAQDALLRQFAASQAAAEVEAAINTALAVSKAATIAPPPFNAVAIAAAIAEGVAQEITIASQSPPSFSDQAPTRVTSSTRDQYGARYASNDTVHAYRDPLVGIQQVVQDAVTRSLPQPPATTRRTRVGPQLASTPVSRLLTRDVERATRGRITT